MAGGMARPSPSAGVRNHSYFSRPRGRGDEVVSFISVQSILTFLRRRFGWFIGRQRQLDYTVIEFTPYGLGQLRLVPSSSGSARCRAPQHGAEVNRQIHRIEPTILRAQRRGCCRLLPSASARTVPDVLLLEGDWAEYRGHGRRGFAWPAPGRQPRRALLRSAIAARSKRRGHCASLVWGLAGGELTQTGLRRDCIGRETAVKQFAGASLEQLAVAGAGRPFCWSAIQIVLGLISGLGGRPALPASSSPPGSRWRPWPAQAFLACRTHPLLVFPVRTGGTGLPTLSLGRRVGVRRFQIRPRTEPTPCACPIPCLRGKLDHYGFS